MPAGLGSEPDLRDNEPQHMNSTLPADLASADPGSVAAPATIGPFLSRTRIAYFSMEIATRPEMHTYSGGLGVLAGDTARSCADLGIPAVFVTLISRQGYLRQEISAAGEQVFGRAVEGKSA